MLYTLPETIARLRQWRADASEASQEVGGPADRFAHVDPEGFETHRATSFQGLIESFGESED